MSFHRALRHLCLEKEELTDEIVGCSKRSMQGLYDFMMRKSLGIEWELSSLIEIERLSIERA